MEKWSKVKLGEIAFITSSKRIFAREYQKEGIPFYRGKEIIEKHNGNSVSTELYISKKRYDEIKSKYGVPVPGDILLSSVGTLGVPWLVDEEKFYFKDGNLTWLRCNEKCIPKFLYLWFNSAEAKNQIEVMCIGSTQKALTIDALNKFNVSLPPLEVQKKICNVIYSIMDKIHTNDEINRNLSEQAKILYKEWFIDFGPFEGEMPGAWHLGTVEEIIELHDSKRKPLSGRQRDDMEKIYPYYGATSIMDYVDNYIFDGIYLLLGEDGSVIDTEGYPILQYVFGKFWPNNHAHVITGKNGFSVEMLYLLFSLTNVQNIVTGAVQLKISQQNLKTVEVVVPSYEAITEFDEMIQPIFREIRRLRTENEKLTTLRDNLLPKLMSGELDVSNLDI
jgi:type I restriction enzyme S subunit